MTAADRSVTELCRRRRRSGTAASRRTAYIQPVVAVNAQHLYVSVADEPVRHGPARPGSSPTSGRLDARVDRLAAAASSTAGATERRLKRSPELERHDVVQYGIDDGTDVIENAGRVEQDRLERFAGSGALLDVVWTGVDGDQALCVKRSPADEKRDHHRH